MLSYKEIPTCKELRAVEKLLSKPRNFSPYQYTLLQEDGETAKLLSLNTQRLGRIFLSHSMDPGSSKNPLPELPKLKELFLELGASYRMHIVKEFIKTGQGDAPLLKELLFSLAKAPNLPFQREMFFQAFLTESVQALGTKDAPLYQKIIQAYFAELPQDVKKTILREIEYRFEGKETRLRKCIEAKGIEAKRELFLFIKVLSKLTFGEEKESFLFWNAILTEKKNPSSFWEPFVTRTKMTKTYEIEHPDETEPPEAPKRSEFFEFLKTNFQQEDFYFLNGVFQTFAFEIQQQPLNPNPPLTPQFTADPLGT